MKNLVNSLDCPACGNPSRDGGLCDADEIALSKMLNAAPDLLDELLIQATRQSVTSLSEGRSTDIPLPINLQAADYAAGLSTVLIMWARTLGMSRPDDGGEGGNQPVRQGKDAAKWLSECIYGLRVRPDVPVLLSALTERFRDCWRAIDRHDADKVYLGDCEAKLPPNDVVCKTPLRVRKEAKKAICWRCAAEYDVAELLAKRDAIIDGSLATIREIAEARFRTPDGRLITGRMIEGYVNRRVLLNHGTRHNAALDRDVALYSISEVKEAALRAKYPNARLSRDDARASA